MKPTTDAEMRVIAGSARGRTLVVPAGFDVRPTKDRVREAMFSALDARGRVVDAHVLDLYAGSGALGIEALSRGATSAVLVEQGRDAGDAIAQNIATLAFDDARLVRNNVRAFLSGPTPRETPFDLVLADPPYESPDDDVDAMLATLAATEWLAADAFVSLERPRRAAITAPEGLEVVWARTFGDTLVTFLSASEE
ncbi:MAG: 16S rRNA (guanine(966)-N(2))-methyltransferase RsmD [Actinomycetota bacterium]